MLLPNTSSFPRDLQYLTRLLSETKPKQQVTSEAVDLSWALCGYVWGPRVVSPDISARTFHTSISTLGSLGHVLSVCCWVIVHYWTYHTNDTSHISRVYRACTSERHVEPIIWDFETRSCNYRRKKENNRVTFLDVNLKTKTVQ